MDGSKNHVALPEIKGIVNHSTESIYVVNIIVPTAVLQNFD